VISGLFERVVFGISSIKGFDELSFFAIFEFETVDSLGDVCDLEF